ncbi:hypothetical protein M8C21_027226 [Ambrosia artemisiifolia]|uniref:Uncharacterized protein n=1 Tax=Ambrosia artemisiifolia TaxID=4212 RepID=A0AAD5G7G3_AMBAR|nr:hypothetical protein M8C21_027226 [Ambrosia artemisiifolia]
MVTKLTHRPMMLPHMDDDDNPDDDEEMEIVEEAEQVILPATEACKNMESASINIYQLESLDRWEQHARCAYELFEKDGNRAIMIEELGLNSSIPVHAVLHDWIRHTD